MSFLLFVCIDVASDLAESAPDSLATQGPPYPPSHPVPLHFILPPYPTLAPTALLSGGGAVPRDVVARGEVGGGWALVGLMAFPSSLAAVVLRQVGTGAAGCNWDIVPSMGLRAAGVGF